MSGFWLFVVLGVGLAIWSWLNAQRRSEEWAELARRLGLQHSVSTFGSGSIRGPLRRHPIVVDTVTRGSGEDSRTFTRFEVRFPEPLDVQVSLRREGFWSGLSRLLGGRDIEVGDADFDRLVLIGGEDAARVRDFLTEERRLRVRRLLEEHPSAKLHGRGISMEVGGHLGGPDIETALLSLVEAAEAIAREPDAADLRLREALGAQRQGDVDRAARTLAAAREGKGESAPAATAVEERLVEGEARYVAGDYEAAEARFAEAEATRAEAGLSPRTDLPRWRELARERREDAGRAVAASRASAAAAASEPTARSRAPEPPEETSPAGLLDAGAVSRELFHAGMDDVAIERAFELRFQGQEARARGEIRGAVELSVDAVFGFEPFTRLTLRLPPPEGAPGLARSVQVLVKLKDEAAEALRRRLGESVTVRGTLVACDVFGRNLYLDQARIESVA